MPTARDPGVSAPELLPPPPPLEPIPPPRDAAEAAFERGLLRERGRATVEVRGADAVAPGECGLGVLDGASWAVLAWIDLAGRRLPLTLGIENIPRGEHWVVVADRPGNGRFSYVSRAPLSMRAQDGAVAGACAVDTGRHRLTVDLVWPGLDQPAPPLVHPILRRADDEAWCYRSSPRWKLGGERDPSAPGRRRFEFENLGAGTYTLVLEGAQVEDGEPTRAVVPDTGLITIRCRAP